MQEGYALSEQGHTEGAYHQSTNQKALTSAVIDLLLSPRNTVAPLTSSHNRSKRQIKFKLTSTRRRRAHLQTSQWRQHVTWWRQGQWDDLVCVLRVTLCSQCCDTHWHHVPPLLRLVHPVCTSLASRPLICVCMCVRVWVCVCRIYYLFNFICFRLFMFRNIYGRIYCTMKCNTARINTIIPWQ